MRAWTVTIVAAALTAATMTAVPPAAALAGAGSPAARCVSAPQPPRLGPSARLDGVAVVSACSAWAEGWHKAGTRYLTLILRWNGVKWVQVASPSPGPASAGDFLAGIAVVSASDAWTVGDTTRGQFASTLIEHWTGRKWFTVTSPDPAGKSAQNVLQTVWAVTAKDIWAVGYTQSGRGENTDGPLIEHFDGTSWKSVAPQLTGVARGTELSSVGGSSAKQGFADGEYCPTDSTCVPVILSWNGRAWKQVSSPAVPAPIGILSGLSVQSESDAWAVGYTQSGGSVAPLIEHWNGHKWLSTVSTVPAGTNEVLHSVDGFSAKSAIAVGNAETGLKQTTLIMTWNGAKWTTAKARDPLGPKLNYDLNAVAGPSCATAWIVGDAFVTPTAEQPVAVHC